MACKNDKGYGKYSVYVNRRTICLRAHRVAYALTYGGPGELFVCHTCDTPACCNPDHLWLGTHEQNMADKFQKGRCVKGEDNGRAKLTATEVRQIRWLVRRGHTVRRLARQFGISKSNVSRIARRENWA